MCMFKKDLESLGNHGNKTKFYHSKEFKFCSSDKLQLNLNVTWVDQRYHKRN